MCLSVQNTPKKPGVEAKIKPSWNTDIFLYFKLKYTQKSKANPLQAWTSPEGSRRLRIPDFKKIGT
jgi:hypothetical protein